MANHRGKFLMMVLAMVWFGGATAQPSSSSCTNVIVSMSPCLSYISGNSTTPATGCCTQLTTVVKQDPQCLCQVLNGGGSSLGLDINQTQALALPRACNVQTPPLSDCNAASPGNGTPNSTSGRGANAQPRGNGSSGATSTVLALLPLMFTLLLVASTF